MALAIVQHRGAIHGNTVPGSSSSVVLTGAPVAGNLLIAFVGVNIADSSLTINTTSWTVFEKVYQAEPNANLVMVCLYRYVQGGDTATLPAFATAGSTYWTDTVYEISGVNGTWDNDLLFSQPIYKTQSNASFMTLTPPIKCLALASTARYNGNTNPSYSGTWTTDETHNNNSNYGSASGAHRFMAAGDTIDGAPTQGSSTDPQGTVLVMLCDDTYPISVWMRHIYTRNGNGTPGAVTVPWKPRQGAILVSGLDWADGGGTNPTIGASWTEFKSRVGVTNKMIIACYRYVQVGDTSTIPALVSSGSTFYIQVICELTGVTGTFSTDHVGNDTNAYQATGASLVTTSDTTTANKELALTFYGNYSSGSICAISGTGWNADLHLDGAAIYGTSMLGLQYFPTGSSTVQATLTAGDSTKKQAYIQTLWRGGGSASIITMDIDGATYAMTPGAVSFSRGLGIDVDGSTYSFSAQDIQTQAEQFRAITFSDLHDTGFVDWDSTASPMPYSSFFNTCQSLEEPSLKTQTPYIYTFMREGTADSEGALLQVDWDWITPDEALTSARASDEQQIYVFRNGLLVGAKKNRIRGKGRSVHLNYRSDGFKDFNILGWSIFYDTQAQQ
jgi:hypothetical protein